MMPPKISRTIFEAVSEALFRELKLEIEYDSASGKQVKSLITPLGLVQQDGVLFSNRRRLRFAQAVGLREGNGSPFHEPFLSLRAK